MFRILVAAIFVVVLAGCSGPVLGSGNLTSRSYDLDGFNKIDANSAANVEVTRGDTFSVQVEVSQNAASSLEVSVKGDTLSIALGNEAQGSHTLRAKVTMPELTGVKLDGASGLRAELAGEDLTADLNGASQATLTGTAGRVTVKADGASTARFGELRAGDVQVSNNGTSTIEISADGAVTGRADGNSTVKVSGSPTSVDVEAVGLSHVIRQ
jgi:hypothetical protein